MLRDELGVLSTGDLIRSHHQRGKINLDQCWIDSSAFSKISHCSSVLARGAGGLRGTKVNVLVGGAHFFILKKTPKKKIGGGGFPFFFFLQQISYHNHYMVINLARVGFRV